MDIAIREAEVADMPALMRLATLDSSPLPEGKLLVAEDHAGIRAAVSVDSHHAIADPFAPTAQMQALLRLRADQLARGRRRDRRRRNGLLVALHLRPRNAA
jgi:hypothetical protein